MQVKTRTEELLRQLSTSVVALEEPDRAAARRERIVARLEQLTAQLPVERRKLRPFGRPWVWASAASLVLLAGYAWRKPFRSPRSEHVSGSIVAQHGSVQIVHSASEVLALPNEEMTLSSDDEVVTGRDAHARARLESGAEVEIDPDSSVRLAAKDATGLRDGVPAARDEAVTLARGRVEVRVPKLGPARTFSVETPEAAVIVHGTKFSVERHDVTAALARTSVKVEEGIVAVRHHGVEVLLHAGDRWSSGPSPALAEDLAPSRAAESTSNSAPLRAAPPAALRNGSRHGGVRPSPDTSSRPESSSLAVENRLLQAAMAARQEGNPSRAASLASELIARYPQSPIAEEARVERMRALLEMGGPPAAEPEARAYLLLYPQGFARQEASRIASKGEH